ncbi:MAG: ABC transporter permease subunit [Rhodospirillales bacterium]|nr:ABC transporter permease subunit [Rhodospirillales bacterium]
MMARYLPLLVVLVAWEVAARCRVIDAAFVSSPSEVLRSMALWYGSGRILPQLAATLGEIAVGASLSFLVGVALGLLIGWYRPVSDTASPVLFFLDAVPVVAIAPMAVLVIGIGPWIAVLLVFLLTVLPITFSVAAGVRTVPAALLRMGIHFGASDRQLFRTIVLPAIAPYIFGALRGNIGRALAGALVGEWLGSHRGLGSMMFDAAGVFEVRSVYVGALSVVIISLLASAAITAAEHRLCRWRPA